MPTDGMILSGISLIIRKGTVIGWRAGESRKTGAEGESGKPRISQAKGQR